MALAAGCAFIVNPWIPGPSLTLVFVLPVMAAATFFGWGPSLVAVAAGVLAFDFFFTRPFYSFRVTSPTDMWAAALLLVIAAIVSTMAADSRRRALEARRFAGQAQVLQDLAHVVIQSRPELEVVQAAATALAQIFREPSVIFTATAGSFRPAATAGGAEITSAEEEAARGSLDLRLATRGGTYPFKRSRFDFWPVATTEDFQCVIGVDFLHSGRGRPKSPERFVEIVSAYLATALRRPQAIPSANER